MNTLENRAETNKEQRVIGTITSSGIIEWSGRKLTRIYVFPEGSTNSRERVPIILRGRYNIPQGTKVSVAYEHLPSGINVCVAYTNLGAFKSNS